MNSIINCFQLLQSQQAMCRGEEKLCLKWNDFQENAISAFGTLRENRELADVTLACEDGPQVEAHKVILASSSPFFLNLLRRNKHPHPLIYMRGLKPEDLVAMIDFLYFGEANVYQENMNAFLAVAEELKLKGFIDLGADMKDTFTKATYEHKTQTSGEMKTLCQQEKENPELFSFEDKGENGPVPEETVAPIDSNVGSDIQNLDEQIYSMMKVSEKNDNMICKVCGKEVLHVKSHIEANHIAGLCLA